MKRNLNFNPVFLGIITLILVALKVFVTGFALAWLWVVSPLWVVAGLICLLAMLGKLIGR